MSTTTKKHRAPQPLPAAARPDLSGGAHRAHRTAETVFVVFLGVALIVLAATFALRG